MCLKVRRCTIITISVRFDTNAQCDPQNHRGDSAVSLKKLASVIPRLLLSRSEERRVGKECLE